MRTLLILCLALVISSCGLLKPKIITLKPPFPEPIKELTEPCPDLKKIEGDKVAVQDLLRAVVENYTLYYQCSVKNDGWNDWYKRQKELYDQVK
jgi:hypothetical protein